MKLNHAALFLDRDGTINVDVDFLSNPDDLQLLPRAARAIREANELGIPVFVITNQSGIARGILSERELTAIHLRLKEKLAEEGAKIDEIYYCPHHPDFGMPPYRKSCTCRKPKTGMLQRAAREFGIDLSASFVIGDRCVDMIAGRTAKCGTVLVLTGYGSLERDECVGATAIDHVAADLFDAWTYVKEQLKRKKRDRRST